MAPLRILQCNSPVNGGAPFGVPSFTVGRYSAPEGEVGLFKKLNPGVRVKWSTMERSSPSLLRFPSEDISIRNESGPHLLQDLARGFVVSITAQFGLILINRASGGSRYL